VVVTTCSHFVCFQGDSGGVLQVYQSGYSYEQIGVSKTVGCRANKTPGVYTGSFISYQTFPAVLPRLSLSLSSFASCISHSLTFQLSLSTDIRNSVKWILYNTKDARYCRKPKVTSKDLINAKRLELESNVKEAWNEEEEEEVEEQEEETF
jgi:hypothetical protein